MTAPSPKHRLFVHDTLAPGVELRLPARAAHHLVTVLRAREGARVALFNGRDGEWAARLLAADRKAARLAVDERLRPQAAEGDLWLAFAALKRGPTDLVAEKATELGASRLIPLFTRRGVAGRVRTERLKTIARAAAEQCGRLTLPEIAAPTDLDALLGAWPADRALLFCDERGAGRPLLSAAEACADTPAAVLIGPEGGFAPAERDRLLEHPACRPVALGPLILRAETAAIAALAILGATREKAGARLQ